MDQKDAPRTTTRDELYRWVWEKPLSRLASNLDIPATFLATICDRNLIPRPAMGHWTRLERGMKVVQTPLPDGVNVEILLVPPRKRKGRSATCPEKPAVNEPRPETVLKAEEPEREPLHALGERFIRLAESSNLSERGLVELNRPGLPQIKIGPHSIQRVALFLSRIMFGLKEEAYAQGRRVLTDHLCFKRGDDEVWFEIEEKVEEYEREPTETDKRKPSWTWNLIGHRPCGKVLVTLRGSQGFSGSRKWTESSRRPIQDLAPIVLERIQSVFESFEAARQAEIRREEARRLTEIRWEQERRQKEHNKSLSSIRSNRRRELLKAAWLWSEQEILNDFIEACRNRWGPEPCERQRKWIEWAEEVAESLDPLRRGYPDPEVDGPLDETAIPRGGPYPSKSVALPSPFQVSELSIITSDSSRSYGWSRW